MIVEFKYAPSNIDMNKYTPWTTFTHRLVVLFHFLCINHMSLSFQCHPIKSWNQHYGNGIQKYNMCHNSPKATVRYIIPPELAILDLDAIDVTVAVVSSLAGAVSQAPRIAKLEADKNKLKQQLESAQAAFIESKTELGNKIKQLEDSMFEMDREFEGQSNKMKKQYDTTLRDELQALTVRLKSEYEMKKVQMENTFQQELATKMEVQKNILRQDFLKEKLNFITDSSDTTRRNIAHILEEQARMTQINQELETALELSRKEIETLAANKNNGRWPFSKKR